VLHGLNYVLSLYYILYTIFYALELLVLHRREITEQERRYAEARMMEGFQSMMDRYEEQRRQLKHREPWVAHSNRPGNPPSVMTVTHINQTKDLYVCFLM